MDYAFVAVFFIITWFVGGLALNQAERQRNVLKNIIDDLNEKINKIEEPVVKPVFDDLTKFTQFDINSKYNIKNGHTELIPGQLWIYTQSEDNPFEETVTYLATILAVKNGYVKFDEIKLGKEGAKPKTESMDISTFLLLHKYLELK